MTDLYDEDEISINDTIKSMSVACLEELFANAIAETLCNEHVGCHIAKLEISHTNGVKIRLELNDDD